MSPMSYQNVQLQTLLHHGCAKLKVSDPKQLAKERQRCQRLGLRLGSQVNTAYRKPWLYVTLAGKVRDPGLALAAETMPLRRPD